MPTTNANTDVKIDSKTDDRTKPISHKDTSNKNTNTNKTSSYS